MELRGKTTELGSQAKTKGSVSQAEGTAMNGYALTSGLNRMSRIKAGIKKTVKHLLRILVWIRYSILTLFSAAPAAASIGVPKRILLINTSQIGDLVISTCVIPVLRSAFPDVELGFVAGSWSEIVVCNHPEIKFHHRLDYWRHNRGQKSRLQKWIQYRKSRATALRQIRALHYDVAICLFSFDPDFLDLAWIAGIPERIGFRHSLAAPFATKLVAMPTGAFIHQGVRQAELLKALTIDPVHFEKRRAILPPDDSSALLEVQQLTDLMQGGEKRYRIIHMGAGAPYKELPFEFWRELAEDLSKKHSLVFTGHGDKECNNIVRVIADLPNCINAGNRLSWNGFVATVRSAEVLYGVDSASGHVAAAVGTPCIIMSSGVDEVGRWRPDSVHATVFSNPVPCSPCFNPCSAMTCLHAATPRDLVSLG